MQRDHLLDEIFYIGGTDPNPKSARVRPEMAVREAGAEEIRQVVLATACYTWIIADERPEASTC
jgi:hypothetical protein